MTEKILLIDQGNTRLKWAMASDGELLAESYGHGDFITFAHACRSGGLEEPERVLFSSVAGEEATREMTAFCESHWGLKAQQLKSAARAAAVRNGYLEPENLGVDRWLAIIGAVERYGKPVVVWDLGTATTLDAVDGAGRHIGGMIFPGPATMLRSLGRDTRLNVPDDLAGAGIRPGRSTTDCIGNGVFAAQIGALNQFLRNLPEDLAEKPKLVVTGGAAPGILTLLDFECTHDPWLVFRGMLAEGIR